MAVDLFLKIDGVNGESRKKNHQDEIDIISFDFGAVQHGSFHTGGAGGGAGKAEISDIRIQKEVDKSSPLLFKACASGKHIKEAVIYSQKAGDGSNPLTYYKIKLEDIIISDIHNSGSSGGDSIMESVTFNCAKVTFDYQAQNADGGKDGGVVTGVLRHSPERSRLIGAVRERAMMRDADELLKSGDLDGARSALVEVVRAKPGDAPARMFLFQLLALAGEWDKAKLQLNTLAQLSPESQMLSVVYGQAIDAERQRAEVFAGRAKALQHVSADWMQGVVDAIDHFANDRISEGQAARDGAFDAVPDMDGTLDGTAFDWIADGDGRFGPCFEAIIGGRYGLQGFDAIDHIKSEGPKDLRDLVWYPVQIAFRSGQSVAALLPARYPGLDPATDAAERLARATGWRDAPWGSAGSGQHLWTLSNGDERGLLSLRLLKFA